MAMDQKLRSFKLASSPLFHSRVCGRCPLSAVKKLNVNDFLTIYYYTLVHVRFINEFNY